MPYVVAEPCINCKYTDCVEVCPVDCFYEGPNFLAIQPDECIDCDACVPVCPVDAIYEERDLPEEWEHYTQWNEYLANQWRDLAALPERLSTGVSETVDASVASYRAATDASDSWWGWGRRLVGRLWTLRSLLTEHRALLVRYGMMLRVATPGFLLLVVGAALTTVVLAPGAVLAVFAAWIL